MEGAAAQNQGCQVKHTPVYSCSPETQSHKCTSNRTGQGQRAALQSQVRGTFPTGKMANTFVPFVHPCLCFSAVKNKLALLKVFSFLSTHYQSGCHVWVCVKGDCFNPLRKLQETFHTSCSAFFVA